MDDKLCFVQFLHPGSEHEPDQLDGRGWTKGPHRRKFMESSGQYVDGTAESRSGTIVFWGEWEAQSDVIRTITHPIPAGPRWVYRPYFRPLASYRDLQNTDPFVFGEQFHYTGCLQHARLGPTQMRNLLPGSVILFGSCLRRTAFMLDTVLVISSFIDHSKSTYSAEVLSEVSDTYASVTLAPWYTNTYDMERVHRLYFGASRANPYEEMYSFFPCLPATDAKFGFARPIVELPGVITPNQTQNKKLTALSRASQAKSLWDEVVRQVWQQGLCLGTYTPLPARRS